jgi:hypothetical protein
MLAKLHALAQMEAPSSSLASLLAQLHALAEAPSSLATLSAELHALMDARSSELQALALMEPSSELASVPAVLLPEVVRWLPSPLDIASLDCTSRLFHVGAPRSAIEEGLRMRAEAAGHAVEAALPAGETSWSQWLLWEERRLLLACQRPVASCDEVHSAYVDAAGQLLTCGRDGEGCGYLGQGEGVQESAVPRTLAGLRSVLIRTVAVGGLHTLVCSDEGVAYSFGEGRDGQLGHGGTVSQHTPRVVEALQGVHISVVAAGVSHSLALSEAGELYSCGFGRFGQLGHGDRASQHTPRLVAALQGVRVSAVAAGVFHSLSLREAGGAYSFGCGSEGQLGHGDTADTGGAVVRVS